MADSPDLFEELHSERTGSNGDLIYVDDIEIEEWQCVECGKVVESKVRPGKCPHCNTVNGDLDDCRHVMIRREACGWFD